MATVASTAPTSPPVAPRRSAAPVIARRWLRKVGFAFAVAVIVSPAILVFLWMLSLSLKNEIDNLAYPPVFIPSPPTLANYVHVFTENAMGLYFLCCLILIASSGLAHFMATLVLQGKILAGG